MNPGIACIAVGTLVIAARAPLVFAPERTLRVYQRMFASDARVRAIGAGMVALGAWVVAALWGEVDLVSGALSVLGWILGFAGAFLLLLPGRSRGIADSVLAVASESVDPAFVRVVGVLAVALGAGLVWLGYRQL